MGYCEEHTHFCDKVDEVRLDVRELKTNVEWIRKHLEDQDQIDLPKIVESQGIKIKALEDSKSNHNKIFISLISILIVECLRFVWKNHS